MRKKIVAVIGTSGGTESELNDAEEVGRLIAGQGWTLICGGLTGVMESASKGAAENGGTVIGILPGGDTRAANSYVTHPIATNMGHARNMVIVHTADAAIAVGGSHGTLSEIAIALKLGKPVFGIGSWNIDGVRKVADAREAIDECAKTLD